MPYTWDAPSGQYVWTQFEGVPGQPTQSALEAALFAPDPTRQQEYTLGARGALGGGFTDRPGASQYLAGMQDPLYGQYIMDWGSGVSDPSRAGIGGNIQSFQNWLRGPTPAQGVARQSRFHTFSPTGALGMGQTSSSGAEDWANIVNMARAMGSTADVSGMAGYNRWGDILADDNRAMALANMAMYQTPGSIGGGRIGQDLRNRAINRMYEDWAAPLADQATGANWLAYITGEGRPAGMVREDFRVPPTTGNFATA